MQKMTIDEEVRYLMQGTEYGNPELKQKMALEPKERLTAVKHEDRSLRVYCGFDPRTADLHIGHTVDFGCREQARASPLPLIRSTIITPGYVLLSLVYIEQWAERQSHNKRRIGIVYG